MPCPRFLLSDWMPLPGGVTTNSPLFVIGDIHGRDRALDALLDWISQSTAPNSTLISLGDVIDYGPHSLKCQNLLHNSPFDNLITLPGNHEIMLALALQDPDTHFGVWEINGGSALLEELNLQNAPQQDILNTLNGALPINFVKDTLEGPSHYTNGDCLFVHAGVSPHIPQKPFLTQKASDHVAMDCHWAWIRDPFLNWTNGWNKEKTKTIFHGHTASIRHGFTGWTDLTALYKPEHYRVNLDVGAADLEQLAWAEIIDSFVRIGIVHVTGTDVF